MATPLILGPEPMLVTCPICNARIMTRVKPVATWRTHAIALVLCLCCCCPCALIPYCVDCGKNIHHYCTNCGAYIGRYQE